jgi:hypothetical protein
MLNHIADATKCQLIWLKCLVIVDVHIAHHVGTTEFLKPCQCQCSYHQVFWSACNPQVFSCALVDSIYTSNYRSVLTNYCFLSWLFHFELWQAEVQCWSLKGVQIGRFHVRLMHEAHWKAVFKKMDMNVWRTLERYDLHVAAWKMTILF